jgi:glycosyltransferase involved in cell wall biosynthesis
MEKRSILFLTNAYPDFDSSYRGIFIKKMATLLHKEGYRISVVTPKIYKGSRYFEDQNGMKIYRFPFFAKNRLLIEYEKVPYLKMLLYYISGFFLTIYVMLKNRCGLIHVHWAIPTGLIGVLAGALLRKPLVVTIHGSDFRMAMGRSSLLNKLFLFVCKRARNITCVSEVQKKEIEQAGIEEERIHMFPMGIDEKFLEAGRNREQISNNRPFTILSNRNLLPIYNVSLLIRAIPAALKEEPKIKFLIAGDGSERENLEREAKNLNVESSIQFLGRVPHEKMPSILAQSDVYVSTSLYDGASVSLLEAMACGTFPIVTDILSNREWIIDAENGFLIPTGNEYTLARKIVEAIRNNELLAQANKKNREIIEQKAHWKVNIRKIANIYESSSIRV